MAVGYEELLEISRALDASSDVSLVKLNGTQNLYILLSIRRHRGAKVRL